MNDGITLSISSGPSGLDMLPINTPNDIPKTEAFLLKELYREECLLHGIGID